MKKVNKILSVFLAILMVFSIIPMTSIEASAATLTQSQFDTKLSQVKSMYPHGSQKYEWSVNGSVVGWECHGYGRWISWYVWGVDFANGRGANWTLYKSTSSSTYIDSLVPGDVVRYRTSTSKAWNHTIFITGISGSTIYYTDCNSDGKNTIKWNQTVSKSTLAGYLKTSLYGSEAATYGYIAHYTPNTLLGGSTSCSCSTSYAGTYICTTSSLDLTIRSGHGSSYSAIGSIPPGATVEVTKASGTSSSDWAHVTYNGVSGYASMQYLTKKQAGQERDSKIYLRFSNSEYGNSVESVRTNERLYLCYEMFDANTGDAFDSYVTEGYSVKITIYKPDGSVAYTQTSYSDNGWIYIENYPEGDYTGEAVFTWESGTSQTFYRYAEIVYEPRVTPSVSDVQLSITGTNSKTISISYSGATKSDYIYMDCTTSGDCFGYDWGEWNDGVMSMTITGIRAGQGVITLELRDYDTDELLATEKVYVTVVAPTYTVSYNANGGTGAPSSQTKYHNTTLTLSSTKPTQTGYTFLGWSTSSSATSATYSSGGNFTSNANTTLYAVWKANTYTVKYNANGGTGSMSNSSHTYDVSKALTSNTFVRTGYTFLGWSTSSTATSATYTNGQSVKNLTSTDGGTVNLYAIWSKNPTTSYTLSYNANGGTGTPTSQTGYTSYTISSTVPTRFGYTFLGWSTSSTATSATYEPNDTITLTTNTTLYAVWKSATTLSVGTSYSANVDFANQEVYYAFTPSSSGEYTFESTGSVDSRVYVYNTSGTEIGYDDDSSDEGTNFKLSLNLTSGAKYYIKVRAYSNYTGTINFNITGKYTISYNANGGTGAPSSQTKIHGVTLTLSSITPMRTGYTFIGWSTSSTATSATYQPSGRFTTNANTTLYAVWSKNPATSYTLSYNANGGTGAPSSQTGSTTYTISNTTPDRTGYVFLGWSKSSSATAASYQPGDSITITSNTTLYAVWKADTSTLVVNSTYNATISSGGEMKYYTFTPSSSGKYVIYSTADEDTKVFLYNSSGTELDSDDDGGDGNNFRLEYNLTAGTTYRFGIKYWSSSKTGTIPFTFGRVYTVLYNANGGTGAPSSQSKDYGAPLTLSDDTPTKEGHTFLGWSTSSTATSAAYSAGGSFTTNANTTLYAVWRANGTSDPENSYGFEIKQPSRTTIRHKDGIKLHANVEGTAPAGSYVVWTASNGKFKTEEINGGDSLKIISNSNGKTTFTATLYSADGEVLAVDSIEMKSQAGFFDKIGSFFRSLFGTTKIYEN